MSQAIAFNGNVVPGDDRPRNPASAARERRFR